MTHQQYESYSDIVHKLTLAWDADKKYAVVTSKLFWNIYNDAKALDYDECMKLMQSFATGRDWIQYQRSRPNRENAAFDLKFMFPNGKVWKHPNGEWRFYFN